MSRLDRLRPHTEMTVLKAPSAPGLWLAFGTWRGGEEWPRPIIPYSAGKGVTRDQAERACLGEMAEHLSIGVWAHDPAALKIVRVSGELFEVDPRQVLVHDLNDPNDPGSEGVAAGETLEDAIEGALCERIERIARQRWWSGEEKTRPIAEEWLCETGVRAYEASLRGTMTGRWRASFFMIGEGMPLETMVAITEGPEGRSLGTAAALNSASAARSALNEAILEEVPLLTGAGKRADQLSGEEEDGLRRSSILSGVSKVRGYDWPRQPSKTLEAIDGVSVELTHPVIDVPVVRYLIVPPIFH